LIFLNRNVSHDLQPSPYLGRRPVFLVSGDILEGMLDVYIGLFKQKTRFENFDERPLGCLSLKANIKSTRTCRSNCSRLTGDPRVSIPLQHVLCSLSTKYLRTPESSSIIVRHRTIKDEDHSHCVTSSSSQPSVTRSTVSSIQKLEKKIFLRNTFDGCAQRKHQMLASYAFARTHCVVGSASKPSSTRGIISLT
jgi:hypothetical protein